MAFAAIIPNCGVKLHQDAVRPGEEARNWGATQGRSGWQESLAPNISYFEQIETNNDPTDCSRRGSSSRKAVPQVGAARRCSRILGRLLRPAKSLVQNERQAHPTLAELRGYVLRRSRHVIVV
jgi:hypothetical protein